MSASPPRMNTKAIHDVQNKRSDALKAIQKAKLALDGLPISRRDRILAKIARAEVVLDEADTIVKSVVVKGNQETRDEEETCPSGRYDIKEGVWSSALVRDPVDEHEQVLCGLEVVTDMTAIEYNSRVWMTEFNNKFQSLLKAMVSEPACPEVQQEGKSQAIPITDALRVATARSLIQESMAWLDAERAKEEIKRSAVDFPNSMDNFADRIAWLQNMKLRIKGAASVTDKVEIAERLMAVGTEWLNKVPHRV